jgi:hypothetical protein
VKLGKKLSQTDRIECSTGCWWKLMMDVVEKSHLYTWHRGSFDIHLEFFMEIFFIQTSNLAD